MNQRKTLEVMWVNVRAQEKKREKAFVLYPWQVHSTIPHK